MKKYGVNELRKMFLDFSTISGGGGCSNQKMFW